MSDLLVILNWIFSMITNDLALDQHAAYKVNNKPLEASHLLNLNDVLNGFQLISNHPVQEFITTTFGQTLDSLNNTQEYYMHPSLIMGFLKKENLIVRTKIINHNGLCQLHYYLTIISLYGTICYTLACLLDRIFKLKV